MKWLVWLLLIINVAVFGFFKLQAMHPAESPVGHEPMHPEKLKILSEAELAALPKTTLESVAPASSGQAPAVSSVVSSVASSVVASAASAVTSGQHPSVPVPSVPVSSSQTPSVKVHSCYDWG